MGIVGSTVINKKEKEDRESDIIKFYKEKTSDIVDKLSGTYITKATDRVTKASLDIADAIKEVTEAETKFSGEELKNKKIETHEADYTASITSFNGAKSRLDYSAMFKALNDSLTAAKKIDTTLVTEITSLETKKEEVKTVIETAIKKERTAITTIANTYAAATNAFGRYIPEIMPNILNKIQDIYSKYTGFLIVSISKDTSANICNALNTLIDDGGYVQFEDIHGRYTVADETAKHSMLPEYNRINAAAFIRSVNLLFLYIINYATRVTYITANVTQYHVDVANFNFIACDSIRRAANEFVEGIRVTSTGGAPDPITVGYLAAIVPAIDTFATAFGDAATALNAIAIVLNDYKHINPAAANNTPAANAAVEAARVAVAAGAAAAEATAEATATATAAAAAARTADAPDATDEMRDAAAAALNNLIQTLRNTYGVIAAQAAPLRNALVAAAELINALLNPYPNGRYELAESIGFMNNILGEVIAVSNAKRDNIGADVGANVDPVNVALANVAGFTRSAQAIVTKETAIHTAARGVTNPNMTTKPILDAIRDYTNLYDPPNRNNILQAIITDINANVSRSVRPLTLADIGVPNNLHFRDVNEIMSMIILGVNYKNRGGRDLMNPVDVFTSLHNSILNIEQRPILQTFVFVLYQQLMEIKTSYCEFYANTALRYDFPEVAELTTAITHIQETSDEDVGRAADAVEEAQARLDEIKEAERKVKSDLTTTTAKSIQKDVLKEELKELTDVTKLPWKIPALEIMLQELREKYLNTNTGSSAPSAAASAAPSSAGSLKVAKPTSPLPPPSAPGGVIWGALADYVKTLRSKSPKSAGETALLAAYDQKPGSDRTLKQQKKNAIKDALDLIKRENTSFNVSTYYKGGARPSRKHKQIPERQSYRRPCTRGIATRKNHRPRQGE